MKCKFCEQIILDYSLICDFCGESLVENNNSNQTSLGDVLKELSPMVTNEPEWGINIISGGYHNQHECPDWLKPLLRNKSFSRGVVIWDKKTLRVTSIRADQALLTEKGFRNRREWVDEGILVGEPSYLMKLSSPKNLTNEEKSAGKWILTDLMQLSPNQAQELFDFITSNEDVLKEIAASDENFTQSKINETFHSAVGDDEWISLGLEELFKTNPQKAMELWNRALKKKGILEDK